MGRDCVIDDATRRTRIKTRDKGGRRSYVIDDATIDDEQGHSHQN